MFCSNSAELRAWVILHLGDVALFAVQHRSEISCPSWRETAGWNRSGPKQYVGSPLLLHTRLPAACASIPNLASGAQGIRAWLRNDDLARRRGTWDARTWTLDANNQR